MLSADSSYDTRADKLSVVQAQPFVCSWIVVQEFVKLLPRLHLINPFLLSAAFFESTQELLAGFHRHSKRALRENHNPITPSSQGLEGDERTFAKLRHVRYKRHID